MKLLSTLCVLIFAFGCTQKSEIPEQDLGKAIERFNEAFVVGDTSTLAKMITENYVHTNSSWRSFGKKQWLTYMGSRSKKLKEGLLEVTHYQMDEYAVERFENTAIVTARITSRGLEDGSPFEKNFRVTNVWIIDSGRWLRAAFHDTTIE